MRGRPVTARLAEGYRARRGAVPGLPAVHTPARLGEQALEQPDRESEAGERPAVVGAQEVPLAAVGEDRRLRAGVRRPLAAFPALDGLGAHAELRCPALLGDEI